jgi:ATP-dependent DNA helicase RecG
VKALDIADQPPTAAEFALALSAWEGQFVEFKEAVADSLARELVAFANSAGGRIYIGVADNKKVEGITVSNRLLSQVQDIARNCDPSVAVNLVPFRYDGHGLLMLEVPEGRLKPYSCAAGYFLRTGPNSQKLTRNELVEFVLGLDLLRFEGRECRDFTYPRDFNQREFEAFLRMSGIAAGRLTTAELLVNLALARQDGSQLILTNAAILFFGKEPSRFLPQARVSCVLFRTPERLHILDRKDLNEGLLENLEQAEVFLLKHLPVRYEIKGFSRIEHREFPLEAIREGLVNALMHRDYNVYGGNVFVELYPDRLAIVNPGGLPPGLAEADFGIKSVHRNPLIADLFSRAGKVERAGTGIRRIRALLAQAGCAEPQFRFTAFFDLVLPRHTQPSGTSTDSGPSGYQVGTKSRFWNFAYRRDPSSRSWASSA